MATLRALMVRILYLPLMYTQCKLEKENTHTTAYIPSKFAKLNKIVKIKTDDGWDCGWKVIFVGHTINEVTNVRQQIKKHRRNTGDSLPKEKR